MFGRRTMTVAALFVLTAQAAAADGSRPAFVLIEGTRPRACIVTGPRPGPIEQTAIQHLSAGIEREAGKTIDVVQSLPADGSLALLVVGTMESNPGFQPFAEALDSLADQLKPEGFVLKTLTRNGRHVLCVLGHDERGVLYGVQEALGQIITHSPGGDAIVRTCETVRHPAVSARGTYSLTCWGMAPRYDRKAWEDTIDSMSAAGMNRIMFWMDGLFRSSRFPEAFLDKSYFTGVVLTTDDIRSLIDRAHRRGMESQLGSGVFGWFTSQMFAEKYKEASDHAGSNLCPSHPLAQKLTLEYLSEMMDVFPQADGYMLEIRDEIRDCMCEKCQKPLDDVGSKQFGQSELDLLEALTKRVWEKHPKAKFVWLIGYDNHPRDPMYYDRIRRMGQDPRHEWLEVRGSWKLPTAGKPDQPLRELSPRTYVWGGGYYAIKPEGMQQLVQRITREGLVGYLPAYEPGFGTSDIYGERVPYPVDLIPFCLTQFYYRTFTWEPGISRDALLTRAHRQFFDDSVPPEMAADLLFLRDFMQQHHTELTCIAPGLIRTSNLAEGVEQIWNDRQMPDKKAKLTQLAERVRSLRELAKGGGDMLRLAQIESRIQAGRDKVSRRSARSFELMQRCIDDVRAAVAERSDDVQNADDTLARIEARIQEYLKSRPAGQAVPALERVRQQELSKR